MNQPFSAEAQKAAELIKTSKKTIVFTGAGISTPSGIPDFRSARTGLWTKYDPMQVASLTAFRHHPDLFYNWLRPLVRDMLNAQPNPAHIALARLEDAGYIHAIATQNIDGLHQRAGSKKVFEVHGSLTTLSCLQCRKSFPAKNFVQTFIVEENFPRCPECGLPAKPDIVLFEEMLPQNVWDQAYKACLQADCMIVIGSSLEVTPAAFLPDYAVSHGAKLIINTLSTTYLDDKADLLFPYDVAQVWPEIASFVLQP